MVDLRWSIRGLLALTMILPAYGCGSSESTEGTLTASISGDVNGDAQGTSAGAKALKDKVQPVVRIETSLGAITVELDWQKAPLTVENFLSYVESGHYQQTVFHQVVEGYMVLGGGFTADLLEKPGLTPVRNEAHNGLSNKRGTIAMARQFDTIDSSTCQFFINLSDNTALDHKSRTVEDYGYCVFGRVIEGMEVVDRIGKVPVQDKSGFEMTPSQPVVIKSAKRIR